MTELLTLHYYYPVLQEDSLPSEPPGKPLVIYSISHTSPMNPNFSLTILSLYCSDDMLDNSLNITSIFLIPPSSMFSLFLRLYLLHYIYFCGQESLRRNGVAIMVNKRV